MFTSPSRVTAGTRLQKPLREFDGSRFQRGRRDYPAQVVVR